MRLLTRSDFDGLGCAVLLKELEMLDDIKFVHPKDIQDGKIEVTPDDLLANIPYVKGCGLWFDHHSSEVERKAYGKFEGCSDTSAPSATSVIYNYYGGEERFSSPLLKTMVAAVDKADTADFTVDEILNPTGWVLASFIMDPRTGLGRYKDYRISKPVEEILAIKDVRQRVKRYFEQDRLFRDMIQANTTLQGNVIVLDLRNQEEIFTGNRFVLYSLYPEQNISIQIIWGFQRQNIAMTCGHSIINKTAKTDIGSLMLEYGGGGHRRVGTCQVPVEEADVALKALIERMNADG